MKDTGSRTEADAARYEAAHNEPDYFDTPEGRGYDPVSAGWDWVEMYGRKR